eukprot:2043039-Rhodomonas_salina.2
MTLGPWQNGTICTGSNVTAVCTYQYKNPQTQQLPVPVTIFQYEKTAASTTLSTRRRAANGPVAQKCVTDVPVTETQ